MRDFIDATAVFVGMPQPRRSQRWSDVYHEVVRSCVNPIFTGTGSYNGVEEPYLAMDSQDFLRMLEAGPLASPNFYSHIKTQECVGVVYIDDFGRARMGTRPVPFVMMQVKPDPADKEVCSMPAFPASAYRHIKNWIEYGNHIFYPAGS